MPPALAVGNLLVSQNGLAGFAPPLRTLFLVSHAGFVELQEAPLRPAIVVGLMGVNSL